MCQESYLVCQKSFIVGQEFFTVLYSLRVCVCQVLAHALLNSTRQARSLLQRQHVLQHQPSPATTDHASSYPDSVSMKRAQHVAGDILNLSQSDIDDLLSVSEDSDRKVSETETL